MYSFGALIRGICALRPCIGETLAKPYSMAACGVADGVLAAAVTEAAVATGKL